MSLLKSLCSDLFRVCLHRNKNNFVSIPTIILHIDLLSVLPGYICFSYQLLFIFFFKIGTEPSDNQYLVVDIGLGALPSLMIGNCGPHETLVKRKPPRHLLSFIQIFSIISFLFFQTSVYVIMWYWLKMQPW